MGKLKNIIKKINEISPDITVKEDKKCIVLEGELDNWEDIVKVGKAAVSKNYLGVINNIKLKGHKDKIKLPKIQDEKYEGRKPDVLIIGGGISGCAIARELSRFKLDIMLVDKDYDLGMAASSRNDGQVHVGIDLHKGTLKWKYNILGNRMYGDLCKELGVEFRRQGQNIVFSKRWESKLSLGFRIKSKMIGLKEYRYLSPKKLKELEPNIPEWNRGSFFHADAGVVSPYKLTVALAENSAENGAEICLNTAVLGMNVQKEEIRSVKTNRGTIYPKLVINCAGTFADKIAEMANDRTFTIHPRKGTILILDKKSQPKIVNTIMAKSPVADYLAGKMGNSKGGGLINTIDHNVLVGPDAFETPKREDYSTEKENVDALIKKHQETAKNLTHADVITYFSGVRAPTYEEDFVIRKGIFTKNIIEVAGIQSPGLTCAPAFAIDVAKWASQMLNAKRNEKFNPIRKAGRAPHLAHMSDEERNELIKQNPDYGVMICRCEEISKGEILDALNSPVLVPSTDAIKRRVRAGMGRCQGGFCGPLVVQIIAEKTGLSVEEINKANSEATIIYGDTKEGK